jgi:hypothetical protein
VQAGIAQFEGTALHGRDSLDGNPSEVFQKEYFSGRQQQGCRTLCAPRPGSPFKDPVHDPAPS